MNDTHDDDTNGEVDRSPPDTSGKDWHTITDVEVVQSRITLPVRARERYDIGSQGEVLDVVVHPASSDKDPIYVEEARVGGQHRILLPAYRVRLNDLEGEYVDIEVRDTGLTHSGVD